MSPAGTAGGTAVVLSRLGAEVRVVRRHRRPTRSATRLLALLGAEGIDTSGLVRKADHQTSASVIPVAAERRPAGVALHRGQRRVHPRRSTSPSLDGSPTSCTSAARSSSAARRPASCSRTRAGPRRDDLARHPGARATPTCSRGRRRAARTPTTCCPTTSRCSASPGRLPGGRRPGAGRAPASAASRSPRARRARWWSPPTRRSRCRPSRSTSWTPRAAGRLLRRVPARDLPRAATCARPPMLGLRHRGTGGAGARHRCRLLHTGLGPGVRAGGGRAMRAVACADTKLSVVELADPSPDRRQLVPRGAALRDLRLRPARPRALRRAGRGDGGARLRRVHAAGRRPR